MTENTPLSVYITGATQGLGREVTRQLVARGHSVAGTAVGLEDAHRIREAGGLPVYSDPFRAQEIISTLKMIAADVVVNLAPQAINSQPLQNIDWDHEMHVISEGTEALAAAVKAGAARFLVHTSYTFLYGDAQGEWVDENARLATDDHLFYAAAAAEATALAAPGCVLRAGYNYGPENAMTTALSAALIAGRALPLGEESAWSNWVHTADLAAAVVLAVEQQPAGEVFNIADDNPAPITEVVRAFAASQGMTAPRNQRLPLLARQLMLRPTHAAMLDASARARTDKAKTRLGWTPRYAHHSAGLDQTLLAWRAAAAP